MPGKVFINYRRDDDAGFTQALYLRLENEFDAGDLFMDVEGHIRPGDDFVQVLNAQVAACDVLLVVIGPRWSELLVARQGARDDFVTIEIKAALMQGKRVIPVLVGGAAMPRADALPEPIRALARRNAVGLRPERFKADCQGLIAALKEQLADAEQERGARTEAERHAVEAARQQAEAEAAARTRAAEQRGRAQAAAGLSTEDIRKAEELANWDFVKERSEVKDLRDHLARFPGGTTERYALARLEGLVWAALGASPTLPQLRAYLDEFPKGANANAAEARIGALTREAAAAEAAADWARRETEAWGAVAASTDKAVIYEFLRDWPDGQHMMAARARLKELSRGRGALRRGMLIGAGVTGVVAASVGLLVSAFGKQLYEQWFWLAYMRGHQVRAERALALKAKEPFWECAKTDQDYSRYCPGMVVLPVGEFIMGSPDEENKTSEQPRHRVTIKAPFAVSVHTVTFDQYDACYAAGGCKVPATDYKWGRGKRPAIGVSWDDAQDYVAWLSKMTGHTYRLLSEAEWEYAARAVTSASALYTKWHFGDADAQLENYAWFRNPLNRAGKTQPVGTKKPNAFGLYDMHGNVWQWVQDCWNASYRDKPDMLKQAGGAWTEGDCSRRGVRGGSWDDDPGSLRSASRFAYLADVRFFYLGFRVGRTLSP